MVEVNATLSWTFVSECPIPDDVIPLLVSGETPIAAYKTFRDSAIFTSSRLIVRDAQGIRGKKIEIYSLPCSAINMWSSENAGSFIDINSEIELWTRAGHIKVKLGKDVDIRKFDRLIGEAVLNHHLGGANQGAGTPPPPPPPPPPY